MVERRASGERVEWPKAVVGIGRESALLRKERNVQRELGIRE